MRIALFPDEYLPECTRVHGKMFHELALEFIRQGHEVVVITPGKPNQSTRLCVDFFEGVEVWRFRNGQTRGVGKVFRAINETLLSVNAWLAVKSKLEERSFDACINYSPTIFFGPLMRKLKRKYGCFNYLILRDMFPQWAIDEGLISDKSPITSYFRFFEKLNYKASDTIGLMSDANVEYFNRLHPGYKNLKVLRNWADTNPYSSINLTLNIRERFNLQNKVIYFYGGNIGHAQDMSNLLRLVCAMKEHTKAHFLFVGQGDEVELVLQEQKDKNLTNLTFIPSVSQDEYKQLLTQVDVGLFSLARSHQAHNFPGKLLGYMVQSLPILGSVNPGNDLIKFINDESSGFAYVNGEDEQLLSSAMYLLQNEPERHRIGCNAKQVLINHFSVESAVNHLLNEIQNGLTR
ncbi:glycosyltransferase family 4 protein [Shewanella sp. SM20]|uniref:glycosyltransferase family 4 protein n=1 Tax=Shewanella sp. SM20 TaxID=2912792 RepID=UPI0021DAD6EB|nr:glycosyltransferase family 4 protein [Shewanella sp. SM20]MCU8093305.1 glycosyltransferase family 4 protein [Shewanella sp. SM20]